VKDELPDDLLRPCGAGLAVGRDDDIVAAEDDVVPDHRVKGWTCDLARLTRHAGSEEQLGGTPIGKVATAIGELSGTTPQAACGLHASEISLVTSPNPMPFEAEAMSPSASCLAAFCKSPITRV